MTARRDSEPLRLLYLAGTPPQNGTGSPIVVRRHADRLAADGHVLDVVHLGDSETARENEWGGATIGLFGRKPWWPPYREANAALRACRHRLWASAAVRAVPERPDMVLTLMDTDFSSVAPLVSRRFGCPLGLFFHDCPSAMAESLGLSHAAVVRERRRAEALVRRADAVWAVSRPLLDDYRVPRPKGSVLLPMPAGSPPKAAAEASGGCRLAHCGRLHDAQVETLEAVAPAARAAGHSLTVVTADRTSRIQGFLNDHADWVTPKPPFPRNDELLDFLSREVDATVVPYARSIERQSWAATSFPSRLVEFAHLRKPVLVFAPPETAVAKWCRDHNFYGYSRVTEREIDLAPLRHLSDAEFYAKAAAQAATLAETEFDPDRIQAAFAGRLKQVVREAGRRRSSRPTPTARPSRGFVRP